MNYNYMKAINTYILEKLKITKSTIKKEYKLNKQFKSYTEMVNDLIKQNIDGFCLIEKSTENMIDIYKKTFAGYRESLEDLYNFSNKNKDIEFVIYPIYNDEPMREYKIMSSQWIDTDQEFDRDYLEHRLYHPDCGPLS